MVIFLGAPDGAKPWASTLIGKGKFSISETVYRRSLSEGLSRVKEFQKIKEIAERAGVRAFLFGGTAASFAHYARWDLLSKEGDQRFDRSRFDYSYAKIYRESQDLDIVIDGPKETIDRIKDEITQIFPHFQGSREAWEIRSLRETYGNKEAIIGNPDFENQHSDSQSLGLIEITGREPFIGDTRSFESINPSIFIQDTLAGKVSFLDSKLHTTTKRFKDGRNPEIYAVIRTLIKALQFDIEISDNDVERMKEIISKADWKSLKSKDVNKDWIEKNARKIFSNSINLERTYELLDAISLRKVFSEFGNPLDAGGLTWYSRKEPLRSFPIGSGKGKTAEELGISLLTHETKSLGVFDAISNSPVLTVNALVSRNEGIDLQESASEGWGFYTIASDRSIIGSGYSLHFRLKPEAREGSDFKLVEWQKAPFIIVRNREAIELIPGEIHLDPISFLHEVGNLSVDDVKRGLVERARFSVLSQMKLPIDPIVKDKIFEILRWMFKPYIWKANLIGEAINLLTRDPQIIDEVDDFILKEISSQELKTAHLLSFSLLSLPRITKDLPKTRAWLESYLKLEMFIDQEFFKLHGDSDKHPFTQLMTNNSPVLTNIKKGILSEVVSSKDPEISNFVLTYFEQYFERLWFRADPYFLDLFKVFLIKADRKTQVKIATKIFGIPSTPFLYRSMKPVFLWGGAWQFMIGFGSIASEQIGDGPWSLMNLSTRYLSENLSEFISYLYVASTACAAIAFGQYSLVLIDCHLQHYHKAKRRMLEPLEMAASTKNPKKRAQLLVPTLCTKLFKDLLNESP